MLQLFTCVFRWIQGLEPDIRSEPTDTHLENIRKIGD
jgi:hypothetical protein